jgi:hypothetical protein
MLFIVLFRKSGQMMLPMFSSASILFCASARPSLRWVAEICACQQTSSIIISYLVDLFAQVTCFKNICDEWQKNHEITKSRNHEIDRTHDGGLKSCLEADFPRLEILLEWSIRKMARPFHCWLVTCKPYHKYSITSMKRTLSATFADKGAQNP